MEENKNINNLLFYDEDKMAEFSSSLSKAVNSLKETTDNMMWSTSLPLVDRIILEKACNDFKRDKLKLSEEEYKKYCHISSLYRELSDYYSRAEEIKRRQELGFIMRTDIYDINLTEEEAFLKYAGCDKEHAKKIYELLDKVDSETESYKTTIRQQYKGDLAGQLGIDRGSYEESAQALEESLKEVGNKIKEAASGIDFEKYKKGFQELSERLSSSVISEKQMVDSIDENENSGPNMGM